MRRSEARIVLPRRKETARPSFFGFDQTRRSHKFKVGFINYVPISLKSTIDLEATKNCVRRIIIFLLNSPGDFDNYFNFKSFFIKLEI